jgi:cell division protein ftsB homolog
MKWVTLVLVSAIALFQYQLWIGKGSYHDVVVTDGKIAAQQATNANLQLRNNALSAEVADLADGSEAITEIARVDLGYIEQGETYYRLIKRND